MSKAKSTSEAAASGLRALESKALAEVDAGADRQADRLLLHLRSGSLKTYADRPECNDPDKEAKCQQYSLVAHARTRGVFVVSKLHYESLEWILVNDDSGEETVLSSFPIFSPSGKHLLVLVENDETLGFVVQIWRRDAGRFVLDWSGSPDPDASYVSYKMLRWPSEEIIEVQSQASFVPPKPDSLTNFTVRRTRGGWRVISKSP